MYSCAKKTTTKNQTNNKKLKRQNKKNPLIHISKFTKIKRKRSQMPKNKNPKQTKQQNQTNKTKKNPLTTRIIHKTFESWCCSVQT